MPSLRRISSNERQSLILTVPSQSSNTCSRRRSDFLYNPPPRLQQDCQKKRQWREYSLAMRNKARLRNVFVEKTSPAAKLSHRYPAVCGCRQLPNNRSFGTTASAAAHGSAIFSDKTTSQSERSVPLVEGATDSFGEENTVCVYRVRISDLANAPFVQNATLNALPTSTRSR